MRKIPIILVIICLLIMVNLAHSDATHEKPNIDKGKIINVMTNIESKIIVGHGATVIIKSNNETNARVIATVIDLKQGGKIRELLNEKELQLNASRDVDEKAMELQGSVALPLKFTIEKAYPNPFNPVVNVKFGLPENASVHFMIHDIAGRLIGDYNIGDRSAGWHEFSWNASDMLGQEVGTGVYLLTIQAGDKIQKQKITYIK